jgi:hypothetical protein
MSIERELLKRTLKFILPDEDDDNESLDYVLLLYNQITDILAQPEQSEQEPVAYVYAYDYLDSLYYATDKDVADYPRISRDGKPLYTAPPKREPLSKEQYMKFFTDTYDSVNPITDFVRAIEKAHGITGEDDE